MPSKSPSPETFHDASLKNSSRMRGKLTRERTRYPWFGQWAMSTSPVASVFAPSDSRSMRLR